MSHGRPSSIQLSGFQTFSFILRVTNPARTTAAAFPRYLNSQVLADSASLHCPALFVRRCRAFQEEKRCENGSAKPVSINLHRRTFC
jgi:hypothetical protein